MMVAALTVSQLAAICGGSATAAGALVGVIFRAAAVAWREERDAAIDKAERLEDTVAAQATRIEQLETKVDELEHRTNIDAYAERSAREHREIVSALGDLRIAIHANTTALEFLFKQLFPSGVVPAAAAANAAD